MHGIEPEELMAYLDGELDAQRAAEAARHMAECPECKSVAADIERVSRKLLEWQIEEPGPGVERTIVAARPMDRVRPVWRRGVPWLAGLAAAGMLLFVLVPSGRRDDAGISFDRSQSAAAPSLASRLTSRQHAPAAVATPDTNMSYAPALDQPTPVTVPRQFSSAAPAPPSKSRGVAHVSGNVGGIARDVSAAATGDTLIIRTAQITLLTTEFARVRVSIEDILKRHGGHIGSLSVAAPSDSGQTLQATLRVPAAQLDATLAEIRRLGRVENEQQTGEEVTQQVVDLEARLANARNTERRLSDILSRSTGKIADVLAVENEIDRVRGEIERMEAERKNLGDRVSFATLDVRVNEEYKAHLAVAAPSTFSLLHNAAVEGYRSVADGLVSVAMFLLSSGPALLLWAAVLFFPVRYAWRRLRRLGSRKQAE
jgi:hypothetical protein